MERRYPSLIGPLILITIGVLFLLANMGMLPYTFWEIALRFWPLLLILVGIDILIGRRSLLGGLLMVVIWIVLTGGALWLAYNQGIFPGTSAAVSDTVSQPLEDLKSATVEMNIGMARTNVTSLNADSGDLFNGTFRHAEGTRVVKTYNVAGTEGRLSLKEEGVNWAPFVASNSTWDAGLNPSIPIALRLNGGVGRATLDLSRLQVSSLSIDSGVGTVEVTLPQTGSIAVRLNGGVGNSIVNVPQGVAARIRVSSGLGGMHVDTMRFPKFGDVYQSSDYAAAASKADIDVDGGVGNINIR